MSTVPFATTIPIALLADASLAPRARGAEGEIVRCKKMALLAMCLFGICNASFVTGINHVFLLGAIY